MQTFAALWIGISSALTPCQPGVTVGTTCRCEILNLHPTQIAVGMIEVHQEQDQLANIVGQPDQLDDFELRKPEPVVIGPGNTLFITDHHHLALALLNLGVTATDCEIEADLSNLSWSDFWKSMSEQDWVYPYDELGRGPLPPSSLPLTVEGLRDDPYRSLAGAVRDDGGYRKTSAPFSDFRWADFFRAHLVIGPTAGDFNLAVQKAMELANSPLAQNLPGYIGRALR